MTVEERLIEGGYVPVDLKAGNVKVGDDVANRGMLFGRLKSITRRGNYMVQFDMDYAFEPATRFTAEAFERIFLVYKKS